MEDWHAFYGMWPNQRDYSFVEHKFDDVVASEIDALGDLPPPFGAAFLLAKQSPVAQRTIVDTVQIPTDQLPRRLTVNKASAPAVVNQLL